MNPPETTALKICNDTKPEKVDEQHISPKTLNLNAYEAASHFLISKITISYYSAVLGPRGVFLSTLGVQNLPEIALLWFSR